MRWLQWCHRWLGLVVLLQVLIWTLTGLYFSLVGNDAMSGKRYYQPLPTQSVSSVQTDQMSLSQQQFMQRFPAVQKVSWTSVLGIPQVVITTAAGQHYLDGRSGNDWQTSLALAKQIASQSYNGPGAISSVAESAAAYIVNFDDDAETEVQVSKTHGRVLAHRNWDWYVADWMFRLHFMDYSGGHDFNNLLIRAGGLITLWFAMAGLILLMRNLKRGDLWRPQTLLHQLQQQQRPVASGCGGGGTCGLCKVKFSHDAPLPSDADRELLSTAEIGEGMRLSCQQRQLSKANLGHVELLDDEAQHVQLTVSSNESISPTLAYIQFERPHEGFTFAPGQFMEFQLPIGAQTIARNYSLANGQDEKRLGTVVRLVDQGAGSAWMHQLQKGDTVTALGPLGDFTLRSPSQQRPHAVFIGGGAGIAPLRSQMLTLLESSGAPEIHFFYGARNADELAFYADFKALADADRLFYTPVLSDTDAEETDFNTGFVHEAALSFIRKVGTEAVDVYVCGPPAMLTATLNGLEQLGVSKSRIRFDDFGI